MEVIVFREKKIPIALARETLRVLRYIAPLSKLHRDLATAIFNHDNKKKE